MTRCQRVNNLVGTHRMRAFDSAHSATASRCSIAPVTLHLRDGGHVDGIGGGAGGGERRLGLGQVAQRVVGAGL